MLSPCPFRLLWGTPRIPIRCQAAVTRDRMGAVGEESGPPVQGRGQPKTVPIRRTARVPGRVRQNPRGGVRGLCSADEAESAGL